jgi:hypothetical protein
VNSGYSLVYLRNGACSIRSLAEAETFHPVIGPVMEAEALYVRQLHLPERVRETSGEFVIWDVGLGAAANALTAIRLIRDGLAASPGWSSRFSVPRRTIPQRGIELQHPAPKILRLVSFDHTSDAVAFALEHGAELGYVAGYESALAELIRNHSVKFSDGLLQVEWTLEPGDFPSLLQGWSSIPRCGIVLRGTPQRELPPAPHAVLFDPYSPKKNPAMWTVPLFADLFRRLDPQRPCALATYTRSTMARVTMLLGGFFAGVGHPSGLKEETTVAANRPDLLDEPLDRRWLERAKSSHSAEPLGGPVYRQAPLSSETWERLRQHPQFR